VRKKRSRAKGAVEAIDKFINNANYCDLSPTERDVQWKVAVEGLTDALESELSQRKRKVSLDRMDYMSVYENYLLPAKKRSRQQQQLTT